MVREGLELKEKYPDVNWIFPLHSRTEDISKFEWVGYPHMPSRRDYDLGAFFNLTKNHKRWYLGYHEGEKPVTLTYFDGFDTTIPTFYNKCGKIWLGWGKTESVNGLISTHEILEVNLINFKLEIRRLFLKRKESALTEFFGEKLG